MGRPLFSNAFRTIPVVRDPQPESVCPYEKWSHRNAFDPDSDEFFENEHAVYEAFIDPADATAVYPSSSSSSSLSPLSSEEEEEEEEEELRDPLLSTLPPFSAPLLSSSDVARPMPSPMAVGAEDPAHLVVDDLHDLSRSLGLAIGQAQPGRQSTMQTAAPASANEGQTPPVRARRVRLGDPRWGPAHALHRRAASGPGATSTSAPRPDYAERAEEGESIAAPLPLPSAPIHVPAVRTRRTMFVDEAAPRSPATPPRQLLPSPPPTVTPRLYSWARYPVSAASSPGSPFGNPSARTSHAHLSPALIRVRDAFF